MEHITIFWIPMLVISVATGIGYLLSKQISGEVVFNRSILVSFCTGLVLILFSQTWSQQWPFLMDGIFFLFLITLVAGFSAWLVWLAGSRLMFWWKSLDIFSFHRLQKADGNAPEQYPGFDGIRLIAASSVIFSHSFLIAEGSEANEPLNYLLGPKNIVALYGVFTFFIISGFLLARSLSKDPSIARFLINRALRILPGFIFCVILCVFLFGMLSTHVSAIEYISAPSTFRYGWDALRCFCDKGTLPGVFTQVEEASRGVINGTLWSLRYELLSYLLLILLWALFRKMTVVSSIMVVIAIFQVVMPKEWPSILAVGYTLPYFAMGAMMFVCNRRFGTSSLLAFFSVLGLLISILFKEQHTLFALFGTYIIIHVGKRPNWLTRFTRQFGDWSYGMYLFGWPVQQLIKEATHIQNGYGLFLMSLPITFIFSAVSWKLVERPALQWKHTVLLWRARFKPAI